MDRNFARALKLVLKHEGGFVNHPKDPGGATNRGITIATFRKFVNAKGTVDDLKHITDAEVAKVYRKQYWNAVKGDELPDGVDYATFDFAVNSGPTRAAKHLQAALGIAQDGVIGPQTLAAAKAEMFKAGIILRLCEGRMKFLKGLKTWPTFGTGWTNRVTDVKDYALDMVGQAKPLTIPEPAKPAEGTAPKPSIPKASEPEKAPQSTTPSWLVRLVEFIVSLFRKAR